MPASLPAERMVDDNRVLFERSRAVGGYHYPNGAIALTRGDWIQHFGDAWPDLARARRRYDPAGILTPGQRIFDRRG